MRSGPFSVLPSQRTPSLFHSSQSHTFHPSCCSGQENQPRFTQACWMLRLCSASSFCENWNYHVLPLYVLYSAKNGELKTCCFFNLGVKKQLLSKRPPRRKSALFFVKVLLRLQDPTQKESWVCSRLKQMQVENENPH